MRYSPGTFTHNYEGRVKYTPNIWVTEDLRSFWPWRRRAAYKFMQAEIKAYWAQAFNKED
jgi:hypothetical protein